MSRPATAAINSGDEGWDGTVNTNFQTVLNGSNPMPIPEFADVATLTALNASLFDRCIALADVDNPNGDYVLYFSDGTNWVPMGYQAAFQADSTAVDVAGIVADFNALLAKLIAAKLMAAS